MKNVIIINRLIGRGKFIIALNEKKEEKIAKINRKKQYKNKIIKNKKLTNLIALSRASAFIVKLTRIV